nr:hypothetical protein [uncultured Acetobacterium sp.]
MTTVEIYFFYKDKKNISCPLTEALIKEGYQQERGGYIDFAHEKGVEVDYTKAKPSQWWHLIESYCNRTASNIEFSKTIKCGELYFWMAEVSGCFSEEELMQLKDKALESAIKFNRRNKKLPPMKTASSNLLMRDVCFDRLKRCIENNYREAKKDRE